MTPKNDIYVCVCVCVYLYIHTCIFRNKILGLKHLVYVTVSGFSKKNGYSPEISVSKRLIKVFSQNKEHICMKNNF